MRNEAKHQYPTPATISAHLDIPAGRIQVIAADRDDTTVEIRPADAGKDRDVAAAERVEVARNNEGDACYQVPSYYMNADAWSGWSQLRAPKNDNGTAMAARMLMIVTTTISSISVMPRCRCIEFSVVISAAAARTAARARRGPRARATTGPR